jgi:Flp pilus assembly protein TadG
MRPFRPTSTMPFGRSLRAWGRAREGGVAVTVAVMTAVLVGVMALSFDLGRMYNLSTELANAADAAALAGATQLDQTPGSCVRAIKATVNATLKNQQILSSNDPGNIVHIDTTENLTNRHIAFLREIVKDADGNVTGNYITAADGLTVCDAEAEYIQVTLDSDAQGNPYRVDFAFAGIVGALTNAFPEGFAIAGLDTAYCGAVPIMMCEFRNMPGVPPLTYANLNANPEAFRGLGIYLKSGGNSVQWGPGNFGFLSSIDSLGNAATGTNDLRDAIGMVNPPFACLGKNENTTEPGASSGARQGFNTRFDIYQGGSVDRGSDEWQPAVNTIKGQVRTNNSCGDSAWGNPAHAYTGPGSLTVPVPAAQRSQTAMPFPMDNCAYAVTGGACNGSSNSKRLGLTNDFSPNPYWDIETYLAVNHPDLPVATTFEAALRADGDFAGANPGLLANDPITRYDVYKWELGYPGSPGSLGATPHLPNNIGIVGTPIPANPSTPQGAEYGGPQCYNGALDAPGLVPAMDRRVIEVLMVNCDPNDGGYQIRGRTPGIDGTGFMSVFLLTPWKDNGSDHEMYVEVIGPVTKDPNLEVVPAKNIVQLYE